MSIQEAEQYLPPEAGASHAFNLVNQQYFTIGTADRLNSLSLVQRTFISDQYLAAGMAHFSNGTKDPYLEELGTAGWEAIQKGRILPVYTEDIHRTLINIGHPQSHLTDILPDDQIFCIQSQKGSPSTIGVLFSPPGFIFQAQKRPIEALSNLAFNLSLMRDYYSGRHEMDSNMMSQRAIAARAHFLQDVLQHGEIDASQLTDRQRASINRFDRGVDSLPPAARYTRIRPKLN